MGVSHVRPSRRNNHPQHVKHLLLATTVLLLAGCSEGDPATQLAACKMEAMRLWPNEDASSSFRRYGDEGAKPFGGIGILQNHIDEYVPTCMTAHGYHQNVQSDACLTVSQFHMQAACYENVRR